MNYLAICIFSFISFLSCANYVIHKKQKTEQQNSEINFISSKKGEKSPNDRALVPMGKFAIQNHTSQKLDFSLSYGSYKLDTYGSEEYILPQGRANTTVSVRVGNSSGKITVKQTYRYVFSVVNGKITCKESK